MSTENGASMVGELPCPLFDAFDCGRSDSELVGCVGAP